MKALLALCRLAPDDLLRDQIYRRLWTAGAIAELGGQITLLAVPITAAVLLEATPSQMGYLRAVEFLPYILLTLPAGVLLDRLRKLDVYIFGGLAASCAIATVPIAWWSNRLSMFCLYSVGFAVSTASVMTQAAAQVVLTQVVSRDRLVEANAKNALAASVAMLLGPPLAGTLIRLVSAPVAMLMTAILLLASAAIRRGLSINETPVLRHRDYWRAIHEGFRFVWSQALLVTMVVCVGLWQFCSQAATSVQILFATRLLGLSERGIGVSYTAGGIGVIAASTAGPRLAKHYGSGPVLALGFCICGTGWLLLASAPTGPLGMAAYPVMHFAYGVGAGFILVNFLALRQSATPSWMLSRMTSTMRWLMLVPAVPGALWGGWLAQHLGLRATLGLSGVASILLGSICGRLPAIRLAKSLPNPSTVSATIRSEQYPAD